MSHVLRLPRLKMRRTNKKNETRPTIVIFIFASVENHNTTEAKTVHHMVRHQTLARNNRHSWDSEDTYRSLSPPWPTMAGLSPAIPHILTGIPGGSEDTYRSLSPPWQAYRSPFPTSCYACNTVTSASPSPLLVFSHAASLVLLQHIVSCE